MSLPLRCRIELPAFADAPWTRGCDVAADDSNSPKQVAASHAVVRFVSAHLWILACLTGFSSAALMADEDVQFFETHVRPLLIEHCQRCHGPKKQEAGLRLDSRQAVLTGGDNGPAIVPGKPDESLLIGAVRHTGDVQDAARWKTRPRK